MTRDGRITISYEEQKAWLVRKARGVMLEAEVLGDTERLQRAAEVYETARALPAEQAAKLKIDISSSIRGGTRIGLSR